MSPAGEASGPVWCRSRLEHARIRVLDSTAHLVLDVRERLDEDAIPGQNLICAAQLGTGCINPRCRTVQRADGVQVVRVHRVKALLQDLRFALGPRPLQRRVEHLMDRSILLALIYGSSTALLQANLPPDSVEAPSPDF